MRRVKWWVRAMSKVDESAIRNEDEKRREKRKRAKRRGREGWTDGWVCV